MFDPAPAQDPAPADPHTAAKAMIAGQMAALQRLADIGMEIAEAAGSRARALAEGGEAAAGEPDPALTYARAARAVRLSFALQSRLMKDLEAVGRAEHRARLTEAGRRRAHVHEAVEALIEAEHGDADGMEAERLSSAAWERLSDEDETALLARPAEELIALICRDLGLSADALDPPPLGVSAYTPMGPEDGGGGCRARQQPGSNPAPCSPLPPAPPGTSPRGGRPVRPPWSPSGSP